MHIKMILYRKYGKTIEITKTQKTPTPRRVSSTRKASLFIKPRRSDSLRRTKRICLRKLLSAFEVFGSPLFITLTFQGSASDVLLASRSLSRFQRQLQIHFRDSQSLFIPEVSPRGRIHFHGLLFGVPQSWGDIKNGKRTIHYGREREERFFAKLWRDGFVDIRQTDGSPRLAHYLAKYIVKGGGDPLLTPIRLIRSSRGFPKEVEYRFENNAEWDYFSSRMKLREVWKTSSQSPFFGLVEKKFYDII